MLGLDLTRTRVTPGARATSVLRTALRHPIARARTLLARAAASPPRA